MISQINQLSNQQLTAIFLAGLAVAFGAGFLASGSTTFTGLISGDGGAGQASTSEIRQTVQGIMDQQLESQRQQLALIANQSENISEDDLSINAQVTDVSRSEFGSLYEATVAITGTVPSRTGGLQSLDQEQTFYISQDGRYLFQEPTDLQQPQQQQVRPR